MKKIYTGFIQLLCLTFLLTTTARSQCIGGGASGTTAYDTTIRFPSGVTHRQVKFPKFDAQKGMLTCVKLVVTMTAIIDTTSFENLLNAPVTVTRSYSRNDAMTGPGLNPSLTNSFNGTQNYPLGPDDGATNSGPDFYSNAKDTIMRQQMTRTLNDSIAISAFYGVDSVAYDYDINVVANVTSSGDIASYMRTSTFVNFRFEYCTCPIASLPLGLKNFLVVKQGAASANLRWEAEAGTDHYFYEIEKSRDGRLFEKVGTELKQANASTPAYVFNYAMKGSEYGRYYFRVKQQWYDGYYRYSEVQWIDFANPLFSTISLYPNPSAGSAGIKFVSAKAGRYNMQVTSAAGQLVTTKEVLVAETDLVQLGLFQKGIYYVKITDVATQQSCVQQLVVQ